MLGRCSFFALCLLAGGSLRAGPVACVPGTLASYEALGSTGCLFGLITVRDVAFSVISSGGGAVPVSDTNVTVTPTNSGSGVLGLQFASSGFSVTGAGS